MSTKTLPPDPEEMNDERSQWAEVGLREFAKTTRQIKDGVMDADWEEITSDFIADLMHFCDRNELEFETVLERAYGHYGDETLPEVP